MQVESEKSVKKEYGAHSKFCVECAIAKKGAYGYTVTDYIVLDL